jgi:hypothetical protein
MNRILSLFLAVLLIAGTAPAVLAEEASLDETVVQETASTVPVETLPEEVIPETEPVAAALRETTETTPETACTEEPAETETTVPEETVPEETLAEETAREETVPETEAVPEEETTVAATEETVAVETAEELDSDEDEWLITLTDDPGKTESKQQESSRENPKGVIGFAAENRVLFLLIVLALCVIVAEICWISRKLGGKELLRRLQAIFRKK